MGKGSQRSTLIKGELQQNPGLKVAVHWQRVSAVIAEFNMGCYRCYGLGESARTDSRPC